MKRIAVVGGGISGLAFYHRILELQKETRHSIAVDLYEAGSRLGGTIQTEKESGFLLEAGPDSFLSEKPAALNLSRRLGIQSEVISTQSKFRRSFVVREGRLHALPEGFYLMAPTKTIAFLGTPLLSLSGKIRAVLEPFVSSKKEISDESIGSFIRRRFGQETLERIGQAMVAGIYTGDPEILSLQSTLPRFLDLERKHGSVIRGLLSESRDKKKHVDSASGPRYSLFLSYKEGMGTLPKAMIQKMSTEFLHLNTPVRRIRRDASTGQWLFEINTGTAKPADAVCLALPTHLSAGMLSEFTPDLGDTLSQISYESVATINFAYRRDQIAHRLDGFGFVVPKIEKSPLIACGFSSQKYAGRAPEGSVLLRAFVGGVFGKKTYLMDDADLVTEAKQALQKLLGIRGEPLFARLKRYPSSMVQYRLGHAELLSRIENRVSECPGLALAGAAYRGAGIPDCIADAEEKAEKIFHDLTTNKEVTT